MNEIIYDNMTRHDVCKAIADRQGELHNFSDKDWEWGSIYREWSMKSDEYLRDWCQKEYEN